jgi:hypothetical protein
VRREAHIYVENESRSNPEWFIPGQALYQIVVAALDHGQVDAAADELAFWQNHVTTEGVEYSSTHRTNSRQLLDCELRFLEDPRGRSHPAAGQIRMQAFELANAIQNVLSHPLEQRLQGLR